MTVDKAWMAFTSYIIILMGIGSMRYTEQIGSIVNQIGFIVAIIGAILTGYAIGKIGFDKI